MVVIGGEQYHHNNPSLLCDNLYLCAARAISSQVMLELGITCVINATLELPTFAYQKQECMQIAVEDKVSAKLYVFFDMVADKIHSVLGKGGVVMIYCRAGMSRSATLCIAYFMKHHDMSNEEAFQFVKSKRPIIHPNIGFLKQLRDYEAKLKFRRSGIKRKFEEDDFSYATVNEIPAFENIDWDDLEVIKPRPKPRIMKLKTVTPDTASMPLEVAQSYSMTEVTICFAEGQPQPVKHSKKAKTGTRPKLRPVSMPVRPRTPANVIQNSDILVSNWSYHDPLSVAESIEPVAMESTGKSSKPVSGGSLKKKAFSKISEPAKVAVSYQTIPWALCAHFRHTASFDAEVAKYTVFTDLHLPLAQKSQEVLLECPSDGIQQKPVVVNSHLLARVRTLVTPVRCSPAAKLMPVILDCPGLFQAQKVESLQVFNNNPTTSKLHEKQHVPSRFSAAATTKAVGFNRSSNTRASIKLPGVKFSPMPMGHKKRPVPNLDLDFREVGLFTQPPIIFEKLQNDVKKFKPTYGVARKILWCPVLTVAHCSQVVTSAKVAKDTIQRFNLPLLLTVPKRSVLARTSQVHVSQSYSYWLETNLETVMPHKEYPYYFPVKRAGPSCMMVDMMKKATQLPKVEVSWLSSTSTTASKLVPKVKEITVPPSSEGLPKKREFLPQINWAATRCEFDDFSILGSLTRPMEDLPQTCKAKLAFEKSIKDSKYRSAACKVSDFTLTIEDPVSLPWSKPPEKYNTRMISRFCFWPLYEVGSLAIQESCQMLNLYCEPTPFKAWAKVAVHSETEAQSNQSAASHAGYYVASCQTATYIDNLIELVDIPDVVGDISIIQPLLATQKDPAKMMIWMEVFKRSVIKARPIKPFVKVCEMLPVAGSRHVTLFNDCSSFTTIPPTVPTARALVTVVSDKPILQQQPKKKSQEIHYALEIMDCFRVDVIHTLNPLFMKIRAIAQREKAVETTEYIRSYTQVDWHPVMEENVVISWTKAPELKYNTERATGVIYMPLRPAHEVRIDIFGCVEEHSALEGPSVINWLSRLPFRKLAPMRPVASVQKDTFMLMGFKALPKYEFVQDIEETPDVVIEEVTKFKANPMDPVDSFWFFELDTPKPEKKVLDLSHLGASAIVTTSEQAYQVPVAAPGSYQLFLPDPEMMDRVGQTSPREIFDKPNQSTSVSESSDSEAETHRRSRSNSKGRRVVIADPPVSGTQSPPKSQSPAPGSRNRSTTRIVSYQRPREQPNSRSRSRNSRIAQAMATSSFTDRRTMDNLTASMRSASELLERRRTEGASRYADPDSLNERGRLPVRFPPPSTSSTSYRSSTTTTSDQSSSGSLWGLLDMAQSWIMKSRRDRSEEKSRYLNRKFRQY